MKAANLNTRLIDAYLSLLKNMDPGSKLDLISKLTKSIKSDLKDRGHTFDKAFGAWDKADNAENIIEGIKSSSNI